METRYEDVEFLFPDVEDEEDPTALGTVIIRANGEMVLLLAESDDTPPFCQLVATAVDGTFAGQNSASERDAPEIDAEWRMNGLQGTGTWREQGAQHAFSFTLPQR